MRREATIAKQQNLTTDSNTRCTRVYSIPLPNEAGSSVIARSELGLGLLSFAASGQWANNKINNASLAADDLYTFSLMENRC